MEAPPFNGHLGVELVHKQDGTAEVALELAPHHLNLRGVAHGGVVASLLDTALGAAVISSIPVEWWCATTSLSIQFIDGAGEGRLSATGSVLRRGGKVAHAAGEIRDAGGRLIATAHGTWHLWPRKPGSVSATVPGTVFLARGAAVRVGKILAVGRNYADHVVEMGAPRGRLPVLFLKPSTALCAGEGTLRIPSSSGQVHHEVELVVLIGKPGRGIAAEHALRHVLGYGVGLDLTLRDLQGEAKERGEPWSVSKGFDGSAPVSRFVSRDAVGDGSGLAISLEVNGECRQRGNTSCMLYPIPELIALASRHMTLERGDLLFTGTPAGVGPLAHGDRIAARIDNVGELLLTVDADPA